MVGRRAEKVNGWLSYDSSVTFTSPEKDQYPQICLQGLITWSRAFLLYREKNECNSP